MPNLQNMKPKPLPLALDRKWPRCQVEGCDKPAKPNSSGGPRPHCSACAKRIETAKNKGKPCDAPGCERTRHAAHRWCRWHYKHADARTEPAPPWQKTHCVHGHELTEENTYVYTAKDGGTARICRTCNRERKAKSYAKKKAA